MKKQITDKLMTTLLLTAICLFASNHAFSQTQEMLWAGCRTACHSTNTNGFFDAGQTADMANVSPQENVYASLVNFLFGFVK